jgi:asparagine synthase (glutamine-hydrolysing)
MSIAIASSKGLAVTGADRLDVFFHCRLDDRDATCARLSVARDCDDATLIVAAWRKWGTTLPANLLGDFAIAIRDADKGLVWSTRDSIGASPLFYRIDRAGCTFATCIEDLLDPDETLAFDPQHVAASILGGRRTDPQATFFRDIRRVPPGHSIRITPGGSIETTRWWKPFDCNPFDASRTDDLIDEGRELLARAVRDRLRPAATIGFHVSGGIDSSAIVSLAVGELDRIGSRPLGYAWQAAGGAGEGARIRAAVDMCGFDVVVPATDAAGIARLLRQDWATGPNQWNLLHESGVQRLAAAAGVRSIFSGWGGDEAMSFNGRGLHAEYLKRLRLGALTKLSEDHNPRAIGSALREGWTQVFPSRPTSSAALSRTYLSDDFLRSIEVPAPRRFDGRSVRAAMKSLHGFGSVSERVEDWSISGRAHGIEYLYPLLDRRVMEFAYRLPAEAFRKGRVKRWFFREMTRGLLPEGLRTEPSKYEPLRTSDLAVKLSKALQALGEEIEARSSTMRRAHFFDMRSLIADLKNPPVVGNPRLGHLRRAIQFLDF